jgi:UDP-3-O-[3-hydroxymyristoyl] glucosamine N-acyltransferase
MTSLGSRPPPLVGIKAQNYEWTDDGWSPFPVAGSVRIEGDVEIGPFATIARGSVGDTVIAKGCRIGQHVNVGHDCRVGDHTLIIAGASLAGWVRVGKNCKIYQGACIKNGVCIGDGAVIGMGAVVIKDVGPGEVWAGNPARRVGRDR